MSMDWHLPHRQEGSGHRRTRCTAEVGVILILAGFYALLDWKGWRRWAFPLVVVGMNSIAVYVMSWTMVGFFGDA